jgi:hypothetical protein
MGGNRALPQEIIQQPYRTACHAARASRIPVVPKKGRAGNAGIILNRTGLIPSGAAGHGGGKCGDWRAKWER